MTLSVPPGPSRNDVGNMFDRIAPTYDALNRILSLRRDVAWRKVMLRHLPARDGLAAADLATGTGDVLLALARDARVARCVGVDLSAGMLARGAAKAKRQCAKPYLFAHGDATRLGVKEASVDAVTIAFGIRNVLDTGAALREMRRVLRPGGRALILEFSLPGNALLRRGYLFYFRHVLPRIGAILSGDRVAYRYLNETVESFPYGEAFLALLREAGFAKVRALPLTFGIATLYVAER